PADRLGVGWLRQPIWRAQGVFTRSGLRRGAGRCGMSAFKGTPGPWQLSIETPTIIKQDMSSIGLSRGGVLIASACGHISSELYPTYEQAIANARLIAAAPELLEALTEIVAAADGDGWKQLDPSFAAARAAIAKATGEQS